MGLTATWAITTEPDRFLALAQDGVGPLHEWSSTTDAGNIRPPWAVLECLEIDLDASAGLVDKWAKAHGSPVLLIGVFDSDGADVLSYGRTRTVRTFIQLEGYASSIFPGYVPFDDDGNELEGAALEELENESEREFNRICANLRLISSSPENAAAALHDWAEESDLTAEPAARLEELLVSREVFAEEIVRSLLTSLGLSEPPARSAGVDFDEVARQLRSRADPASQAAVADLDAGGKWWPSMEVVRTAATRRDWSRPEDNRYNPDLKVVGREELLADLAATPYSSLEEATLDCLLALHHGRYSVYLAPGTSEVVACIGVVWDAKIPPVYRRRQVPVTVAAAAPAFLVRTGQAGTTPFEVTIRRELEPSEAEQLSSELMQRTNRFYQRARSIEILGAAEVTYLALDDNPYTQQQPGYLLIRDVVPNDDLARDWYGQVDVVLLRTQNAPGRVRAFESFRYEAETPDDVEP